MICPATSGVIVADIKQAGKPVPATQRCFVTTAVKLMPSEIVMSHVRPHHGHDSDGLQRPRLPCHCRAKRSTTSAFTADEQRYGRDTAHRVANAPPLTVLRTRHCYLRSRVVVTIGRILCLACSRKVGNHLGISQKLCNVMRVHQIGSVEERTRRYHY